MTDEQMAALLTSGDLGQQEMQLEQQQALSRQLRNQALQPSAGKDAGSQIARGLQGAMAGYAMNQEKKGMDAYGAAKTQKLGQVQDILLNSKGRDPAMQQAMASRKVYGGTGAEIPPYDTAGF